LQEHGEENKNVIKSYQSYASRSYSKGNVFVTAVGVICVQSEYHALTSPTITATEIDAYNLPRSNLQNKLLRMPNYAKQLIYLLCMF
jgi:hypothetical protein